MTHTRRTENTDAPADRAALTEAIEKKMHRLNTPALLRLAESLKVTVPAAPLKRRRQQRSGIGLGPMVEPPVLRGEGVGAVVAAARGLKALDGVTVEDEGIDWAESELLGAVELAQRLKVSRATIDNWRTGGRIVGFQKGLRNFIYPVRQFDRLRPIDGLAAVVEAFDAEEDAWEWLVTPNGLTDGQPPIDALRQGQIDPVVDAARGALDYA